MGASARAHVAGMPPAPIEAGNIDINKRPKVQMPDGSFATVRSMSVNVNGREYLIPTVSDDGRIMEDDEAYDTFLRTKRHLGAFRDVKSADAYAKWLSDRQGEYYGAPR